MAINSDDFHIRRLKIDGSGAVRFGLISDTHGLLRAQIFDLFQGVDHIIHAGDLGSSDILVELQAIADVTAVWGNVDSLELRRQLPEVAEIEVCGSKLVVVHGQQFPTARGSTIAPAFPAADCVVYGHSHLPAIDHIGTTLAVNPGSAGRRRFSQPVSAGFLTVCDGGDVQAELVELSLD